VVKISETYKTFKAGEQEGPLFFILVMNHLLPDTEKAPQSQNSPLNQYKEKTSIKLLAC
jgi:hypothetical protein